MVECRNELRQGGLGRVGQCRVAVLVGVLVAVLSGGAGTRCASVRHRAAVSGWLRSGTFENAAGIAGGLVPVGLGLVA